MGPWWCNSKLFPIYTFGSPPPLLTPKVQFVGGLVNALRLPERVWPGSFDIALNSHHIWHICVVAAMHASWAAVNYDFAAARDVVCPEPDW